MRKFLTKISLSLVLSVFLFGLFSAFIVQPLAAQEEAAEDIYKTLQAPLYEPVDDACGVTGGATGGGNLPQSVRDGIERLREDYETAAQATGVPWQLLAAVHYREANNGANADMQAGNPIGGPYTRYSSAYDRYGYPRSMAESAEFAARHLIGFARGGIVDGRIDVPNPNPEKIKDTLFSYNGRASVYAQQAADLGFDPETQPYEGSPYVMNNYDGRHHRMRIITQDFGGLDGIDTRFGAFTIYARLGGGTSSADCPEGGAVLGSAVQTALRYAWPDYHAAPYLVYKPEYRRAINAAIARGEFVGGGPNPGVDCGGFTTRVMRDSGADPRFNRYESTVTYQRRYMEENPDRYERVRNVTNTSNLQPGDIAIANDNSHTYMFVGNNPGFNGNSASASYSSTGLSWRTPMASPAFDFTGYDWFRLRQ